MDASLESQIKHVQADLQQGLKDSQYQRTAWVIGKVMHHMASRAEIAKAEASDEQLQAGHKLYNGLAICQELLLAASGQGQLSRDSIADSSEDIAFALGYLKQHPEWFR